MLGVGKQILTDPLIPTDEIKKNVPKFTVIIMDEIGRPETKARVKAYLRKKIYEFSDKTFSKMDTAPNDSILRKYG